LVIQMFDLLKNPARVAGIMFAGCVMAAAQVNFAQPGTVNYVEGQVRLDGKALTNKQVGSAVAGAGHVLSTGNGKAEMLLTPGVFVRLEDHSAVKMVTPSLSNTHIQVVAGRAMVEAAQVEKENHIAVTLGDTNTRIVKRGIYEFSASPAWTRTFDGKAEVERAGRSSNVYKGDEVALDPQNAKLKTQDFSVKQAESQDDLYTWSKLRADYVAQANMSAAERYYAGGPGWYGAGWYWDPYFDSYTWLLADRFLWDPFGFGYFSPGYWGVYAPYGVYGYGHGFGHGFPHGAITRGSAVGAAISSGGVSPARGAFSGARSFGGFGGMHGGFGGMHGGFGGRR
jgi:hypothetical protein